MKRRICSVIVAIGLFATNTLSYGPRGHSMVGAIADRRLATANASVSAKVSKILDGLSLADAALLPDEIKAWDKDGPTPLKRLKSHPTIQSQLEAYWEANHAEENGQAVHRVYHFTDVPVLDKEQYADGQRGRSDHDLVHMIPFCISVLRGDVSEDNERKITQAVAIILLAHFFGDIHQPLHVGAEYFAASGKPINPDKGGKAFADEGGNNLDLSLRKSVSSGSFVPKGELHGYWDGDAASTALGLMKEQFKKAHPTHIQPATDAELAEEFARVEPAVWKLPPQVAVKDWAEAMANDILPLAAEAHQRLQFSAIKVVTKHGNKEAAGKATEQKPSDGVSYQAWAGKMVLDELHKGGWRLAALLEQIVH